MSIEAILTLGIIAGVLQFIGYAVYAYDVFRSGVRPNPASWLIWSYGNALVCISYIFLNLGFNPAIDILPIVCALSCIVMSLIFFFWGKFRPLERFEKIIVGIDVLVTLVWLLSDFAGIEFLPLISLHIILLVSALVSFIPLYVELAKYPKTERPRAWVMWTIAYACLFSVVVAEGGSFEAFSYPALYLILHAKVAALASRRLRRFMGIKAG